MNEEILKRVDALAEKLGTTAEMLVQQTLKSLLRGDVRIGRLAAIA